MKHLNEADKTSEKCFVGANANMRLMRKVPNCIDKRVH
jgi:hypothetical protein